MSAQFRETVILQELLSRCGEGVAPLCCDVGAWDPTRYSNTYELWHDRGWSAILVERKPVWCQRLIEASKGFPVTTINTTITANGETSLDALFQQRNLGPDVGVLSIDIDSYDYYVFKNLRYLRPQIVIIEFNQLLHPSFKYCDPEDEVYLRCSFAALQELAEDKGYQLYAATDCNAIFVLSSIAQNYLGPRAEVDVGNLRNWRERLLTWLGLALGGGNLYPVFTRPRMWLYRKTVRGMMWCACQLLNLAWVKRLMKKIGRSYHGMMFTRPSPSMQLHLARYGIAV